MKDDKTCVYSNCLHKNEVWRTDEFSVGQMELEKAYLEILLLCVLHFKMELKKKSEEKHFKAAN